MLSKVAYQRSPDVNDPLNANKDWRDGYAEGLGTDHESMDAIMQEWLNRGKPSGKTGPFVEWKIGFWAGRFTQIDNRRKPSANSHGQPRPPEKL